MSDTPNANGNTPGALPAATRPPFPVTRLLYAVFYGFIAYVVLHILFALAAIQFVVLLVNGRMSDDLKSFCTTLVQYEMELLAFITFVRDDHPYPMGPFPKHA